MGGVDELNDRFKGQGVGLMCNAVLAHQLLKSVDLPVQDGEAVQEV